MKIRIFAIFALLPLLFSCGRFQQKAEPPEKEKQPISEKKVVQETSETEDEPESEPSENKVVENALLKVNGKVITRQEFEDCYKKHRLLSEKEGTEPLNPEEFMKKVIRDELLRYYASEQDILNEPELEARIKREKMKLIEQYILRERLVDRLSVSEEEAREYYLSHPEEFTRPAKIQVRHILTSTLEDARSALQRLREGEEFTDVARDVSVHASRSEGGRLPPFSSDVYHPEFEAAAFPLKVGERSGIVKTDLGYHIIEKTGETAEQVAPYREVRNDIKTRLFQTREKQALESFYQNLINEVEVEVLDSPPEE